MNSSWHPPWEAAACQGKATISNLKGTGLGYFDKVLFGTSGRDSHWPLPALVWSWGLVCETQ